MYNKTKIEKAISDFKKGKMVIVVDGEDRENEGDFIISSEKVTSQDINFMMKEARGLICISISQLLFIAYISSLGSLERTF